MRIICDNIFYFYIVSSQILTFTPRNYLYLSYLTVSYSYDCIKIILWKVDAVSLEQPPKFKVNFKIQRFSTLSSRFMK